MIFEEFKVGHQDPNTGHCDRDYVEIREGKGFLSPLLATLCGHGIPEPITTFSESLYIKVYTAKEIAGLEERLPRFRINYKQDGMYLISFCIALSSSFDRLLFDHSYLPFNRFFHFIHTEV